MGLLSVGHIVSKCLKKLGYYVNSDREYPSLIKGGHSALQVDFSEGPVRCLSRSADIVVALDRPGLMEYLETLKSGGILIHGNERHKLIPGFAEMVAKRKLRAVYLPARKIAYELGGTEVMVNMVLLGLLWKILGLPTDPLEDDIRRQFASKPKLLEIDLKCVRAGYEGKGLDNVPALKLVRPKKVLKKILIDGNLSIALGAIHAGVRAYYAYPMSPSSSILTHMGNFSHQTGVLVKQAEDEITAVQMAAGSMFMGTRALVATSGGGFDLMTETFSMAAMLESPLVVVVAQRPGPATGLPTWTSQGDLNLALHAGHGEYPRVVLAASDPTSAFELTQHAFNIAEEFQVPVVLLTEKVIAETETMVDVFKQKKIRIRRGLVTDKKELAKLVSADRYRFTKSGVSPRWVPGSAPAGYCSNSDEHEEDGTLTEAEVPVQKMFEKRMRKMTAIEKAIPEPVIHGLKKGAKISFVGWGSSKNAMLDAIDACQEKGIAVNYLHFDYCWPLKTKVLEKFFKENRNVHLIEGNHGAQFGVAIETKTGLRFRGKFLKYNGRPFFIEDVLDYVNKSRTH